MPAADGDSVVPDVAVDEAGLSQHGWDPGDDAEVPAKGYGPAGFHEVVEDVEGVGWGYGVVVGEEGGLDFVNLDPAAWSKVSSDQLLVNASFLPTLEPKLTRMTSR